MDEIVNFSKLFGVQLTILPFLTLRNIYQPQASLKNVGLDLTPLIRPAFAVI